MNSAYDKRNSILKDLAISLGLFVLALLPRAYDLPRFVTADEAKWVYRSARFLAAFLHGDLAGTTVNLTPAVTTTWLGSLGLWFYYQLHRVTIEVPFVEWLLSLPEFRAELDILVFTRWPVVILTSLAVVAIYWPARRLFGPAPALIAAVFIALDPHTVALSRILGHDAPVTIFMTLSLVLMVLGTWGAGGQGSAASLTGAGGPVSWRSKSVLLVLSGIAAGLAFLSKAPAFFLIPFAGLVLLSMAWRDWAGLKLWLWPFLGWGVAAYLTFVLVWPAAWVEPVGRPLAVLENAFLSATDHQEAEAEGFWRVPDLGPLYYVVNGGFKLSPLVTVGAGLLVVYWAKAARRRISQSPNLPISLSPTFWLVAFVILFTLFMTLAGKRSPRYILPIFPALSLLAAAGWLTLYQHATAKLTNFDKKLYVLRFTFYTTLTLAALATLIPHTPYYFTYFNPLLGGAYTAPGLVKVGWGEGLDQVGRFLQRELPGSRVGTAYSSTVAPYFKGDLSGLDGEHLDYVVLYSKQVQSGSAPLSPTAVRYYEQSGPIFSTSLNGIHYAEVYRGPAVQPLPTTGSHTATSDQPRPVAFRPLTPYGRIGQPLTVDVLWDAAGPLPQNPPRLRLESEAGEKNVILAEAEGHFIQTGDDLVISHYQVSPPPDLERGLYLLRLDEQLLGEVEFRHFQIPADLAPVHVVFEDQIALKGYAFNPTEDVIEIKVAWQALRSRLPDYTVFVQLLTADDRTRVAGVDTQPEQGQWPTSRWVKDEVVTDHYLIDVPPDLDTDFFIIIIGLYHSGSGQRLATAEGQDFWLVPWTLVREE